MSWRNLTPETRTRNPADKPNHNRNVRINELQDSAAAIFSGRVSGVRSFRLHTESPESDPFNSSFSKPSQRSSPVSCPGSPEARLADKLNSIVQSSLENKATARLISRLPHDPGQQTGGNVPIPGHVHPVNLSLIPIPRKYQLENG